MKAVCTYAATFLALAQSACAPVDILNTITPSSSYHLQKDVSFRQDPKLGLDIYTPKLLKADAPIFLYIHGGGWDEGSKEEYKFIGEAFASEGYVTVIPTYRLYPDYHFGDFSVDTAKAVAWTHEKFGRPVVIMGHSAGAHMTALLGLDNSLIQTQGVSHCEAIRGWIGLAGPYAFDTNDPPYNQIFPSEYRQSSKPINHASKSSAPVFIATGTDDKSVLPLHTEKLAAKLREAGTDVTDKYYEGVDHIQIIRDFSKYFKGKSDVRKDVIAFIEQLEDPQCN